MDYSLLRNKVYLYLLCYYNNKEMPKYIDLGKEIGISRQTASTRVKELIAEELVNINEDNILKIENPLFIDIQVLDSYLQRKNFDAIELKELLFGQSETKVQLAKEMRMARKTVYTKVQVVVYGIISEGKIKYVGSTSRYEERIKEHIKKRPFLDSKDFIILKEIDDDEQFQTELELIHILQPEWNIVK